MSIRTIIWDIGGVLERTENPAPRQKLAERLGWKVEDLSHVIFGHTNGLKVQLGQISLAEHWALVGQKLGLDEAQTKQAVAEFFAGDKLDSNLVTYIRSLNSQYNTAILSNYMPNLREKVEQLWQIGDAFDHLIISAEVGLMKPDPALYDLTLETVGCLPMEAVFIDDFIDNVAAARQSGMYAIWFKTANQAIAELETILAK